MYICSVWYVLLVVDEDLAGDGVGDGGEGLPGEVEGGGAAGAAVDDLDGDGAAAARVVHGVGCPDAPHREHRPADLAAGPQPVARRRDHPPVVLVPVARRRCQKFSNIPAKRTLDLMKIRGEFGASEMRNVRMYSR